MERKSRAREDRLDDRAKFRSKIGKKSQDSKE